MKKLLAILLIAALGLAGFALAEGVGDDGASKFHTLIEEGSFIIQVDSEGDLAWTADDMAQDPSVVQLYDADTLDGTFVVRYDPVGDGDVTVGVRHYSGAACDEMMTWDLHVEDGAVREVTGGSYAVSMMDEQMDADMVGRWLEKDTQFTSMTVEKNPTRGYDIEIVSPVSHGAYVFKTSVLYDCERDGFVYDKGKFWDIDGEYDGGPLGEARTAGTTGIFAVVPGDGTPALDWHDDVEDPEGSVSFVRADAVGGAQALSDQGPTDMEGEAAMEIPITDIEGIRIGQTEDAQAGTGCTVLLCEAGMRAGVDIRGGGPASRETPLLNPLMAAQTIHAIVLAGGSAYGLDAAGGVMRCLEERDIGYDVGVTKVPLVVQSDIFDLTVGDPAVRPDAAMGYEAARLALDAPNYRDGNYGAGCGATVGKLAGMERCMKSGIGSYAIRIGDLEIGAVVVVNALGDVFDWRTGAQLAGLRTEDGKAMASTERLMRQSLEAVDNKFVGNTTLAVVVTNADFDKARLSKIAGMAHDGYARSIRPIHTTADGDSIYAVSVGDMSADQDLVGTLAAEVVSEAITRAVRGAESAYGFPCAAELAP